MQRKRIPKVLMASVSPRKRIWIIPLAAGLIALAMSFAFGKESTTNYPNLFMSLGGWLLTLAGILFARNQAARIALADVFAKLYEQESSTEQYYAKKEVYDFGRAVLEKENRYFAARVLMQTFPKKKQDEIHEARRRLRHFWLLAEAYYESNLMSSSEVFSVAGSPEILLSLEPLEVLAAEQAAFPMKSGPWTSINLLSEWYRLNGENNKGIPKLLPLDEELYRISVEKNPHDKSLKLTASRRSDAVGTTTKT